MIKRIKGSKITDEFLESFGKLYHAFKSFGLCSGDITAIFMGLLDVSDSSISRYLRKARVAGYVTDTYEENRQAMIDRQRGLKTGDENVKDFIFKQLNRKDSKKPLNKTK